MPHCLALWSREPLSAGDVCFLNVNNDLPVITADQSIEWAFPSCLYPRVWFSAPQAITAHLAACKRNHTALLLRLFSCIKGRRLAEKHLLCSASYCLSVPVLFQQAKEVIRPYPRLETSIFTKGHSVSKSPQNLFLQQKTLWSRKRLPKYINLCRWCYEFALQHHTILKCHIQRLRSWYAERNIRLHRSGLDACHGAAAVTQREALSV